MQTQKPNLSVANDSFYKERKTSPIDAIAIYQKLQAEKKNINQAIAEQREKIIGIFAGKSELTVGGKIIATYREKMGATYFDDKSFSKANPNLYQDFLKKRANTYALKIID